MSPPSIDDIKQKTLGIVRYTENAGRIIHYQVTIDPDKKSPSGQFIRFGTYPGDELMGWMPMAGLVLVEVLSTDWVEEQPKQPKFTRDNYPQSELGYKG